LPLYPKKALKRQAKYEKYKAERPEKRKREKERKHKRKQKHIDERNAKRQRLIDSGVSETELVSREQEAVSKCRADRKLCNQLEKERRLCFEKLSVSSPKVVIDCDYDQIMQWKERTSLSKQIRHLYGRNVRSEKPFNLFLTGLGGDLENELKKDNGYTRWMINRASTSYQEHFGTENFKNLVYLTAESENVLQSLDDEKIYIIGGIVDHNRLKNLAHTKATGQQICTQRLPLQEHLVSGLRTVLTVNQVFDILLTLRECGTADWSRAFLKALPSRWKWKPRPAVVASIIASPPHIDHSPQLIMEEKSISTIEILSSDISASSTSSSPSTSSTTSASTSSSSPSSSLSSMSCLDDTLDNRTNSLTNV